MAGDIDFRLKELGIELPEPSAPAANYVPYVVSGNQVFLSGQVTFWNGEVQFVGKVGDTIQVEDGIKAARLCGLNLIAHLRDACDGDLDRVVRCVKLGCFVNSIDNFRSHPQVANGVSDLMVEIFGDKGRHARFAVGVASLPRNVAVEVDGVFEID